MPKYNTIPVTVIYRIFKTHFNLNAVHGAIMTLEITIQPNKTVYPINSSIDYSGIVVTVVYEDGTRHNVTALCVFSPSIFTDGTTRARISCTSPLEPEVYDLNLGYILNGSWIYENPTQTYIDVYSVKAGHTYLLSLGATVGSRFRAMFTTIDVSKASSDVRGTSIIETNNPAVNASVTYTASSNGYIAVAKDNVGVSGLTTYLYDTNTEKTEAVFLPLSEDALTGIRVSSSPTKTVYKYREPISYDGLLVMASYQSGAEDAVSYSIEPAPGKSFDPRTDTTVRISYRGASTSLSLSLAETVLQVTTPPHSVDSYEGIVVSAVFEDGTRHDVTQFCDFELADGQLLITCAALLEPDVFSRNNGYVDNGVWIYQTPTNTMTDIYSVKAGHTYYITLGAIVGTRFRAMFTTVDVMKVTSGRITGTAIINLNSPAAYSNVTYTAPSDGYIILGKDNNYNDTIVTYVYDENEKTEALLYNMQ